MHLLFAVAALAHWLLASDLHVEPAAGAPVPATYGADTNWALLNSTIAAMRRADQNPRVVILSGDFLAHRFPDSVPLAERTMARIASAFDTAFPRAQFVIVPGNNDDPCGDYRATPGSPYFASIARMWAPLVDRNGAAPDFEHDFARYGWYTARLPVRSLRAVAMDSVYFSLVYRSCGTPYPNAPQRELQWFSRTVASLPRGMRALVVMHIPPGVDPASTLLTHRLLVVPFWRAETERAFVSSMSVRRSRIAFAIAGHMHRNAFRLLGGVPMLISPAVSPIYDNNPAFVRMDVAPDGTLQNYTPYLYDEASGAWRAGESFDAAYGVGSFTAAALDSIHERLPADASLRLRWAKMLMSGANYEQLAGVWRTYWCAQSNLSSAYVSCAGLQRRIEVLPIAAGVVGAGLLALLALLAVRLGRARRRV